MALEAFCERERDRLPLWLPVVLGSGIAAWFVLPVREAWIAFMLCSCGLALLVPGLLGMGRAGRAAAIAGLVAAAGCGLVWARAELVAGPTLARPRVAVFTGRIETIELLTARESVRLLLAPDPGQGLPLHVRLNVDADDAGPALAPGR